MYVRMFIYVCILYIYIHIESSSLYYDRSIAPSKVSFPQRAI